MNDVAAKAGLTAEARLNEAVSLYASAEVEKAWKQLDAEWRAIAGLRIRW
jgi:hypothetical protein